MAADILRWLVKDGEELFGRTVYHRVVGKSPKKNKKQNLHDCIDLRLSSKKNVNAKWTILEPGDSLG